MADDEPSRRLSPRARWVWRAQQLGSWGVLLVAGASVSANVDALGPLPWALPAAGLVVGTLAVPALRWSRWRWDVAGAGIDIRHGTVTIRRTLVPWVRVQHVDTRRGLLEQALGLSTVVHTRGRQPHDPAAGQRRGGDPARPHRRARARRRRRRWVSRASCTRRRSLSTRRRRWATRRSRSS